MIDLRWTELTFGLSLLFNVAFFLYVMIYYRRCVYQPVWQKSKSDFWLMLFSVFLIIFVSENSGTDWYHYQDMVWNYDFTLGAINHGERVYGYIISFVNKNYLFFRIIVWGGAFLLTWFAFKRFEINVNVAVYFLMAAYLLRFNYARATLAMASYFLGLSFLIKPLKNHWILSILLLGLFFWGAYEFHHSLLPILILSVAIFAPFDKPIVFVLFIVLLPIVARFMMSNFGLIDRLGNEYVSSKMNGYVEQQGSAANFLGYIALIIMFGTFIIPMTMVTIVMVKNSKAIEMPIKRLYRITICIALFAVSFLFMGLHSIVFVYRFLFMTFIPLTILSVYFYQNNLMNRTMFSISVIWGIMANMQLLFVGLYHTL